MHKARVTRASAIAVRIWGSWDISSGKTRWQWESVNMGIGVFEKIGYLGVKYGSSRRIYCLSSYIIYSNYDHLRH